jgi:hypothetical protein
MVKCIKDLLSAYSQNETNKKIPQLAKQQPMYFNFKGNTEKVSKDDEIYYKVGDKISKNLLYLVEKLTNLGLSLNNVSIERQIK